MRTLSIILFTLFYACKLMGQVNDADKNAALQLVSAHKLALGLSADDLNNLAVSNSYLDKSIGVRYVYLQQTFKNIPVYNQIQVIAFKNNLPVSNAGGRIADIEKKVNVVSGIPLVTAEIAVTAALADKRFVSGEMIVPLSSKDNDRKIEFGKLGISRENITAQLMWVPSEDKSSLRLAWQVYFIPVTSSDYWLVKVDAVNNNILGSDNLTVYCNWDDPKKIFEFGKNNNHINEIQKTNFAGNNLFDLKTSTTRVTELNNSPSFADNVIYRVVPLPYEAPSFMPGAPSSATVNNPWSAASANATTLKWHSTDATGTDYNYTRGNNVWAAQDRLANNTATQATSATSTTALPNLSFNFTPDYTQEPTVTSPPNQQFNITNLFYWNNIVHDVMYDYGFDEAAGNFQNNNLGRGGVGNDHVFADAQDGSGNNSSGFTTPVDGSNGRMQMFLWNAPTPDRDGDVDNGIIVHEYGHGVSERLIGGPATVSCFSNGESCREGVSDYLLLMFTQDWAGSNVNSGLAGRGIGTYVLNQPTTGAGVRSQRYSTDFAINNKVYQIILPSAAQDRGEYWCAAAWEMTWAIIQQTGTINPDIYYNGSSTAGNIVALRLITQGMKLVPCGPGFIDMRDGILNADTLLYGGAYSCSIWEAFRKRGMGAFALQGFATSSNDQTPDFTAKSQVVLTASAPTIADGQNLTYTNTVSTCSRVAISNYLLTDTIPLNVSFVSANNGGTYNPPNRVISWVVNQPASSTVNYQFTVTVGPGAYPGNVVVRSSLFNDGVPSLKRFNVSQVITPISICVVPTVNAVSNQIICNNTSTAAINFTGDIPGTVYNWVNNNTSIGLAASGTGDIASFIATNAGTSPVTATITVTPFLGCTGNPATFTITVNPIPGASANPSSQTICSGPLSAIILSGAVQGTIFNWTRNNAITVTGIPASGSGNISGTLTNTTSSAVVITFTITPTANGCSGTSITAIITVIGTSGPTVNAILNQTYCAGAVVPSIVFNSPVAGATFSWSRTVPSPDIGLGVTSGTGNVPSFTATNTSNTPITSAFTVTASYTNNGVTCIGTPIQFTITVNKPFTALAGIANGPAASQTLNLVSPGSGVVFTDVATCSIISKLVPSGASPVNGNVTAKVWVKSSVPLFGSIPYVARHFEMQPATNPSTATGTVTLYFLQSEFDAFNAHAASILDLPTGPADATGKANLRIYKYPGTSSDGSGLPYTYTGTPLLINPADANIIWNAVNNWWEITFDVTGFSGFTVGTSNTLNFCPNGSFIIPAGATGTTYQWGVDNGTGYVPISNGPNYSGVTTATLTITALPTSFYGYHYRCFVNGIPSTEYEVKFVAVWQGNTNPSWIVASNWGICGAVPDLFTDVVIPSGRTNYPLVITNTSIRSLRAETGSIVIVQPGITLLILGQ